ncbi:MAG: hypothetical protein ACUVQ8_07100 [Nitrososphaeria archaeon]
MLDGVAYYVADAVETSLEGGRRIFLTEYDVERILRPELQKDSMRGQSLRVYTGIE